MDTMNELQRRTTRRTSQAQEIGGRGRVERLSRRLVPGSRPIARLAIALALAFGVLFPATAFCSGTPGSGGDPLRAGPGSRPSKNPENAPALVFNQSGGYAGVRRNWQIYANGRVVFVSGRPAENSTQAVSPDSVRSTVQAILDGGFMEAEQPQLNQSRCADCYLFSLTVRQGDTARTLRTIETLETPPALDAALHKAGKLLEQAGFPNPYIQDSRNSAKDGSVSKTGVPWSGKWTGNQPSGSGRSKEAPPKANEPKGPGQPK